MRHLVLSRRNLLTLLSKLDRVRQGEYSECSIVKFDGGPPVYVIAQEDEVVYAGRQPGAVHPKDVPREREASETTEARGSGVGI